MIRYEFSDTSILEENIHPDDFYEKEQEIARQFLQTDSRISKKRSFCPICHADGCEPFFSKWGYKYSLCPECWTVCLKQHPKDDLLEDYYFRSDLACFRASEDYQTLATNKRKDLWESVIGWIEGRISRYLGYEKYNVADWGSKYVGWLEFLKTAAFVDELHVIEPLPPINEKKSTDGKIEVICLMDVLQRTTEPLVLLQEIHNRLQPNGLLIATCRAGSGFDILTLKDKSSSIFPLDHIILPSPDGLKMLLEKSGFDVLEITTPGLLDMKLIQKNQDRIPADQHFLRYILSQNDELLLERMQGFLQRNNLSSHLRCVAKKVK